MTTNTPAEIEALKAVGQVVARCLEAMREAARPGMTTLELDLVGAAFLEEAGARSAPQLMYNFPGATCISVNEEVAHGIPGDRVLREGDMVNVDVSAELGGFYGDTGASFVLGAGTEVQERLLAATQDALDAALDQVRAGRCLNVIGLAIERIALREGFAIVRNLGSHGVGRSLHEEPRFIPSYYDFDEKRSLEAGQVITIEPFLTTGRAFAKKSADGWTLLNTDSSHTAQFEHTLIVTDAEPIILTVA